MPIAPVYAASKVCLAFAELPLNKYPQQGAPGWSSNTEDDITMG